MGKERRRVWFVAGLLRRRGEGLEGLFLIDTGNWR